MPYRLDKNGASGGVMIYVREDIPSRELIYHAPINNIEGVFLELNLRKIKWLLFGGYNYNKSDIGNFLSKLEPILDHYMGVFDIYFS